MTKRKFNWEKILSYFVIITLISTIVFLIGGSLGMSDKLLNICNKKVCFSLLTFPHQLIRLFGLVLKYLLQVV